MPRPFRFGVQLATLPSDDWQARVQRIEALGYSSVFFPITSARNGSRSRRWLPWRRSPIG